MTRAFTPIVIALALAGCQEGSGQEEAPTVEEQEAADAEQGSSPPSAINPAICDLLDGKHAEQIKQTMVIYDRLTGAITAKEQERAARLNAKITDALAKSARTRAEMKRQGCEHIPDAPKVGVINSPPADDE